MSIVRVSQKGQFVIPKEIRDKLGIKLNGMVYLTLEKGYAKIMPAQDLINELCGSLKGGESMTEALIKEHRREVEKDEKLSI